MMKKLLLGLGIVGFLVGGYFTADALLFDGVKARPIQQNGLWANYFAQDSDQAKTTVILIGGGQWGDYWAQYLAQNNMNGLSLPYSGVGDLPQLPEDIALEYFEKALDWLIAQPDVDPDRIVVMGASRNAELALVVASKFPNRVSGVVAYTVLPYNSDELKPSWTFKGQAIPFVPMEKIQGGSQEQLDLLGYWNAGLAKPEAAEAAIAVEQIGGPVLLISGIEDQVWPSASMADTIAARLQKNNFKHAVKNLQFEAAGHLISTNPDQKSAQMHGQMRLGDKMYTYNQGGTPEGDLKAKQAAREELLLFLRAL
ncbi:MAG: alpha/beta hydrolase fold domain-containing protein [Gilvibacter sp.]|nr:alpha/beta hydrolase fold domain-containing protein [Gilvibacter sp.]